MTLPVEFVASLHDLLTRFENEVRPLAAALQALTPCNGPPTSWHDEGTWRLAMAAVSSHGVQAVIGEEIERHSGNSGESAPVGFRAVAAVWELAQAGLRKKMRSFQQALRGVLSNDNVTRAVAVVIGTELEKLIRAKRRAVADRLYPELQAFAETHDVSLHQLHEWHRYPTRKWSKTDYEAMRSLLLSWAEARARKPGDPGGDFEDDIPSGLLRLEGAIERLLYPHALQFEEVLARLGVEGGRFAYDHERRAQLLDAAQLIRDRCLLPDLDAMVESCADGDDSCAAGYAWERFCCLFRAAVHDPHSVDGELDRLVCSTPMVRAYLYAGENGLAKVAEVILTRWRERHDPFAGFDRTFRDLLRRHRMDPDKVAVWFTKGGADKHKLHRTDSGWVWNMLQSWWSPVREWYLSTIPGMRPGRVPDPPSNKTPQKEPRNENIAREYPETPSQDQNSTRGDRSGRTVEFAELLGLAKALRLKGHQLDVVKLIAEKAGTARFADVGVVCDWDGDPTDKWNGLMYRLNQKLKKKGWQVYRHNNSDLPPFSGPVGVRVG